MWRQHGCSSDYYPDRQDELIATVASIAEVLVGGDLLLAKYDAGSMNNPPGYALVQAAVWAVPVPRSDLDTLFEMYLRLVRIDLTPNRSSFDSGLSWAMEPVASQVALLRSSPPRNDAWSALDYVVAAEDGQGGRTARPIPHRGMETDTVPCPGSRVQGPGSRVQGPGSRVQGPESLDIGMAAHLRGLAEVTLDAFRLAADCGHPDYASAGSFNLGVLLAEGGDTEGAKEAFETAIRSGHPTDAPAAAVELGILQERLGNHSAAIAAFELAIASGHPIEGPRAAELLAQINQRATNAQ